MTDNQDLLEHLIQEHTGRRNAVTQSKLAKSLDIPESTLRSELRRLREERNIPIGNMRDGYFVISDKEELQEFVGHINSEIQSKKNTIEHTLEAFEEFDGDLPDTEDESDVQTPGYDCNKCDREDIPRDEVRWPKNGDYEDQPVCKMCYGGLLMEGSV